ncbi:MAG: hypothetical protein VXW91_06100 [Pseudomonadota bacterium]|nr:hypothetical protein [Pseudomonadota bacterium]MEC8666053.1 hypothetical protein [Pseudomonadota bacterium]
MTDKKDIFRDTNVLTGRLFMEAEVRIVEARIAQEDRERNLTQKQIDAALRAARPFMK